MMTTDSVIPQLARPYQGRPAGLVSRLLANAVDLLIVVVTLAVLYAGWTALRFLLRQDPEVILVGEIRDRATAEVAFQAALTGHLILSTFHAGSAAGAISRLSDMEIAPYLLRSGVLAIPSRLGGRLHLSRELVAALREEVEAVLIMLADGERVLPVAASESAEAESAA